MVSEYFDQKLGSFLHLGNLPPLPADYGGGSVSPGGSFRTSSGFIRSSTTTSFTDEKKSWRSSPSAASLNVSVSGEGNQSSSSCSGACPDTPTSRKGSLIRDDKDGRKEEGNGKYGEIIAAATLPPVIPKMNSEAEESVMQQHIMDMYMRSMQQFTESLAKMKLPMDLHKPGGGGGDLIHGNSGNDHKQEDEIDGHQQQQQKKMKKKDGSRVFFMGAEPSPFITVY